MVCGDARDGSRVEFLIFEVANDNDKFFVTLSTYLTLYNKLVATGDLNGNMFDISSNYSKYLYDQL